MCDDSASITARFVFHTPSQLVELPRNLGELSLQHAKLNCGGVAGRVDLPLQRLVFRTGAYRRSTLGARFHYLITQLDALITDVDPRSGDQPQNPILRLATEGALRGRLACHTEAYISNTKDAPEHRVRETQSGGPPSAVWRCQRRPDQRPDGSLAVDRFMG